MSNNRDDFPSKIKEITAKRVNYLCSYPSCRCFTISASDDGVLKYSNVGEAAHICAAAPGGKRYDSNMSQEKRMGIENCIWMCKTHARLIDTDEAKYTVEILRKWKSETEYYVQQLVAKSLKIEAEDILILEQWYEKFLIKNWDQITEALLRPYTHFMKVVTYEQFCESVIWLEKNLHLIRNRNIQLELKNFNNILKILLEKFFNKAQEKHDGLLSTTPNKYSSGNYINSEDFQNHNDIIFELAFELTKSINEICNIIRVDYNCEFAREKVDLCYTTNVLEGVYHFIVEYKANEVHSFDFESFQKNDEKRLWKK